MVLWLKAFHIIAVIAWMAGLLYLPRLFVYHAAAKPGSELSETLKIMEYRLLRFIMTPAMVAVWLSGPLLAWMQGMLTDGWFLAKFLLVLALSASHGAMARWQKEFTRDANPRPAKFYRYANEVPTLIMIVIVILVVVKPF